MSVLVLWLRQPVDWSLVAIYAPLVLGPRLCDLSELHRLFLRCVDGICGLRGWWGVRRQTLMWISILWMKDSVVG